MELSFGKHLLPREPGCSGSVRRHVNTSYTGILIPCDQVMRAPGRACSDARAEPHVPNINRVIAKPLIARSLIT